MPYTYRRACLDDIDLLTTTRIQVLRAANNLPEDQDMSRVEAETRAYYAQSLADGTHTAILVYDGDRWIGAGGISYYRVMPTYHNPSGWKGYIMNIYTDPAYRRQGIARHTIHLLMQDAAKKEILHISLEATAMGRPLYSDMGFVSMPDEMYWPEDEPFPQ